MRRQADEALRRTGKKEAAAADIGIHPSRLSHKLADGSLSLKELETLGPEYAAEFGRQLVAEYGTEADAPVNRLRRMLRQARAALDFADDVLGEIA